MREVESLIEESKKAIDDGRSSDTDDNHVDYINEAYHNNKRRVN